MIQSIFLIDFTRSVSESWVQKYHDTKSLLWAGALFTTTFVAYGLTIFGTIYIYLYYPSDISIGLASLHIFICSGFSIMSALPQIQQANPSTGILPSAILSAYNTYLIDSAFINASPAQSSIAIQVLGLVLIVFSLGYMVATFKGAPSEFHVIALLACFYMSCVLTNVYIVIHLTQ